MGDGYDKCLGLPIALVNWDGKGDLQECKHVCVDWSSSGADQADSPTQDRSDLVENHGVVELMMDVACLVHLINLVPDGLVEEPLGELALLAHTF